MTKLLIATKQAATIQALCVIYLKYTFLRNKLALSRFLLPCTTKDNGNCWLTWS